MLYDAVVKIALPGNDETDALKRLAERLKGWSCEIVTMEAASVQPAPITGTGNIIMPIIGAKGA